MGRRAGDRFLPVKVIPVLGRRRILARSHRGGDSALRPEQLPNLPPRGGVFADPLGDDVPGSTQGLFDVIHARLWIDVLVSGCGDVKIPLTPEAQRQGLQSPFPGDGGPGAPLGPVGQVGILQDCH